MVIIYGIIPACVLPPDGDQFFFQCLHRAFVKGKFYENGSLAIEQNTLTLDQVTAVLNGKRVLVPPKDIAEVRNAFEIYE